MHMARLVAIAEVRNVPSDIRPFVEFKAAVEDRKIEDNDRVAILNVDSTSCYIPVFLKNPISLSELESELASQDAKMTSDTRDVLAAHLKK